MLGFVQKFLIDLDQPETISLNLLDSEKIMVGMEFSWKTIKRKGCNNFGHGTF